MLQMQNKKFIFTIKKFGIGYATTPKSGSCSIGMSKVASFLEVKILPSYLSMILQ